eukprot:UN31510
MFSKDFLIMGGVAELTLKEDKNAEKLKQIRKFLFGIIGEIEGIEIGFLKHRNELAEKALGYIEKSRNKFTLWKRSAFVDISLHFGVDPSKGVIAKEKSTEITTGAAKISSELNAGKGLSKFFHVFDKKDETMEVALIVFGAYHKFSNSCVLNVRMLKKLEMSRDKKFYTGVLLGGSQI